MTRAPSTSCWGDEKVAGDGLKKGPWTPDEDQKLVAYVQKHGHGSWRSLPLNAGLQRCGKSCRLRWTNYLRPDIKRGRFSLEEDQMIVHLHALLGNRWSAIASHLPRRTDNEIKNYWNTHLKKRLLQMGIDPVTHTSTKIESEEQLPVDLDNCNNLIIPGLLPVVSSTLTHMSQWDSFRAEAEARLSSSSNNHAIPGNSSQQQSFTESLNRSSPSTTFMSSWKAQVAETLRPSFGTVELGSNPTNFGQPFCKSTSSDPINLNQAFCKASPNHVDLNNQSLCKASSSLVNFDTGFKTSSGDQAVNFPSFLQDWESSSLGVPAALSAARRHEQQVLFSAYGSPIDAPDLSSSTPSGTVTPQYDPAQGSALMFPTSAQITERLLAFRPHCNLDFENNNNNNNNNKFVFSGSAAEIQSLSTCKFPETHGDSSNEAARFSPTSTLHAHSDHDNSPCVSNDTDCNFDFLAGYRHSSEHFGSNLMPFSEGLVPSFWSRQQVAMADAF